MSKISLTYSLEIIKLVTSNKKLESEINNIKNESMEIQYKEINNDYVNLSPKKSRNIKLKKYKSQNTNTYENLESKLECSLNNTINLKKKIMLMNNLLKTQGKELCKISDETNYENKLRNLTDFLQKLKYRAKHLTECSRRIEMQKIDFNNEIIHKIPKANKVKQEIQIKDINELRASEKYINENIARERKKNKEEEERISFEIRRLRNFLNEIGNEDYKTSLKLKNYKYIMANSPDKNRSKLYERKAFSIMRERPKETYDNNISV